jgi:hypothetical protein
MIARTYVAGRASNVSTNPYSAVLEAELSDGRTVQMSVYENGDIHVRGWGNIPAKVGNQNAVSLTCKLQLEAQTTCPVCFQTYHPGVICCETDQSD